MENRAELVGTDVQRFPRKRLSSVKSDTCFLQNFIDILFFF